MSVPYLSPYGNSVRLHVHVQPGASRTRIAGQHGDALKIAVKAPPEGGRANAALCEFVAETLGLPKREIRLISGASSRKKVLSVSGLNIHQIEEKLRLEGG